jgi:hypothetical protein
MTTRTSCLGMHLEPLPRILPILSTLLITSYTGAADPADGADSSVPSAAP